jgi:hypothetical protein
MPCPCTDRTLPLRNYDYRLPKKPINFPGIKLLILFNWTAYYKPNSLPRSTVGSSSSTGLVGARARRT